MPELPEIETLRRGLSPVLSGWRVTRATLRRPDFARTRDGRRPTKDQLLAGDRVVELHRLGKQLAIEGESGSVLCVHLGMSGQLFHLPAGLRPVQRDHVHVEWVLEDGSRLLFRDPRRFGGLWCFPSLDELRETRWDALGPDALTVTAKQLREALNGSARAIKAALLDQHALAGVGNIYADEALHRAGLHPLRACRSVTDDQWRALGRAIRAVLRQAVGSGGSTLRDYRTATGESGGFQSRHRVYGRTGQACPRCRGVIERLVVAQRSTHMCPVCQPIGDEPERSLTHNLHTTSPQSE
jgi:formamidopyrimidine-DNA glycosylase